MYMMNNKYITENMCYMLHREIHDILHGMGEKRPQIDTAKVIYLVLIKQMALLIFQSQQAAYLHDNNTISVRDVIYVLRCHKFTIVRLLSYYIYKEEKLMKGTTYQQIEKKIQTTKEENLDLNHSITEEESSDSLNVSIFTDFEREYSRMNRTRTNSIHKEIIQAIEEWNLKEYLTNENLKISKEMRQGRLNDLTLKLSTRDYKRFTMCRRKCFQNKLVAEQLLSEVHMTLPSNISYDEMTKQLFLFLAKETIATILDIVFENREKNGTTDYNGKEENNYNPILIEEITTVAVSAWPQVLGDIEIPYKKDNMFFTNKLIFN